MSRLSVIGHGESAGTQSAVEIAAAFDPGRLVQARRLAGLTKSAVAKQIGVSAVALGHWEAGTNLPRPDHVQKLCEALDVPIPFFAAGRPYARLSESDAHFRSLRRTPAHQRAKAIAFTEQVWELTYALEKRVQLPPVRLPGFSAGEVTPLVQAAEPARAAQMLRAEWDLGLGKIPRMVRVMEQHGVVVTLSPFAGSATPTVDAFSTSRLPRPVVVLTPDRAQDVNRHRFTAAHELGHLIMHPDAAPGDPQIEKEADQFAAELLTPAESITPLLPNRLDLHALDRLSKEWGVSIESLIYRCHELGTVSEAAYRRAFQRLNQLRKVSLFNLESVDGYPGEIPALLQKAFEVAESNGLSLTALAQELSCKPARVRMLLGQSDRRPQLRLV
ncbi:ImmA/IrrE family metallo-endopeptidase (plasmid) [Pseudarthrobacter sp. P1]|uniref:ImmA/IrrE family metallo-endopeptidase n=1 Tax=Pseudarthrobacter sp. P1 TaxID=3418418 RepID=UPI003CE98117